MKRIITLLLSVALLTSLQTRAVTLGQFLNSTESYLDCDQAGNDIKAACLVVQNAVNQKLAAANLYIENNGLVYKKVDGNNEVIRNECSRKTTITSKEYDITLKNSTQLRLSGNTLSKPAVLAFTLPVSLYARVDARDEFGQRIYLGLFLGSKCQRYATDSYYADAGIATTGKFIAILSLEPKFARSPEGDFIFSLKPIFDIQASVGNTQINNFDIHGANALLNIISSATSFSNAGISSAEALLRGEGVKQVFVDPLVDSVTNQLQSILLTDYALNNPLHIDDLINQVVHNEVNKIQSGINQNLEIATASARTKINQALNLDSNGVLYYVLGPDLKPKAVTNYHIGIINPQAICTKSGYVYANTVCGSEGIGRMAYSAQQFCGACGISVYTTSYYSGGTCAQITCK